MHFSDQDNGGVASEGELGHVEEDSEFHRSFSGKAETAASQRPAGTAVILAAVSWSFAECRARPPPPAATLVGREEMPLNARGADVSSGARWASWTSVAGSDEFVCLGPGRIMRCELFALPARMWMEAWSDG